MREDEGLFLLSGPQEWIQTSENRRDLIDPRKSCLLSSVNVITSLWIINGESVEAVLARARIRQRINATPKHDRIEKRRIMDKQEAQR
jgi:hypothetical protein